MVLEIYKLYVEMTERVSARRQTAQSFFLTINTAIVALAGYVRLERNGDDPAGSWPVALAGMILCYLWYRTIRSYRDLVDGRFIIVHEMERELPVEPYRAEWDALGRGERPEIYLPLTRIEAVVPWVFGAIHLFVLLEAIFMRRWLF